MVSAYAYARTRKRTKADFIGALIAGIIAALLGGWMFMLAVGIVHHEWIRACPTIGFNWSVALAALVRGALFLNTTSKNPD